MSEIDYDQLAQVVLPEVLKKLQEKGLPINGLPTLAAVSNAYLAPVLKLEDGDWVAYQVDLSLLIGAPGPALDLSKSATHFQWRVKGMENWVDLAPLSDFKGAPGDPGPQGPAAKVLANGNWGNYNNETKSHDDTGIKAVATVDLSQIDIPFNEYATRENIASGEKMPVILGKIRKWFSDFGALAWKNVLTWAEITGKPDFGPVATTNSYLDLVDRPSIPSQVSQLTNDLGFVVLPAGKGFSSNDFTNEYKDKLDNLQENITLPEGVVKGLDKDGNPADYKIRIMSKAAYLAMPEYENDTIYALYASNPTQIETFYVGKYSIPASGVSLNKTTLTLRTGEEETLLATVSPSNATNKKVVWVSNNTAIATVDNAGKVKAVSDGSAVIKAKTEDGGFEATCALTVSSEFQISSPADLLAFKTALESGNDFTGTTVRLMSDINMSGQTWKNDSLKAFKGVFEGNIKTISNINMSGLHASLISLLEGKVQNLILSNVTFSGSGSVQYVGAISAKAGNNAVIQDSSILGLTANLNVNFIGIGGVVGSMEGTSILRRVVVKNLNLNITRTAQTTNFDAVGGLVGSMTSANPIENCFTTGSIKSNSLVGGIVGYANYSNSTQFVQYCYSAALLESVFFNSNSGGAGGIAGYSVKGKIASCVGLSTSIKSVLSGGTLGNGGRVSGYNSGTTLSANYGLSTAQINGYNVTSFYGESYINGAHKTDAELKTQNTYETIGWDFASVWKIGSAGYPVMKWDN